MSNPAHEDPSTRPGSDDPFATLRKRRRGVRVTTAAAVALGLAISGGSVAAATTPSGTGTSSGQHALIRDTEGPGGRATVRPDPTTANAAPSTGSEVLA
jgi:hypothetical protein